MLDHLRELRRSRRQVEQQIAPKRLLAESGDQLRQPRVGVRIAEFALGVKQVRGEPRPHFRVHALGPGKRFDARFEFLPPGLDGFGTARETDDAHRVRQLPGRVQVVEGRDELADRQISAGAEDHDRARLDMTLSNVQPASQQFIQRIGCVHARHNAKSSAEFNPCSSVAGTVFANLFLNVVRDQPAPSTAVRCTDATRSATGGATILPLPEGEGRGEGE